MRGRFLWLLCIALAIVPVTARGGTLTFGAPYPPVGTPSPFPMSVHGGTVLGTIHQNVLGINNNNAHNSASQLSILATPYATMGIHAGRYPGGDNANVFDWQDASSNTMTYYCNSTSNPYYLNGDFDAYMTNTVAPNNMSVELTTNFETTGWSASPPNQCQQPGDPTVAAAWVTYSNITKGYGVKYWEVGNEEYIPGTNDQHTVGNGWPNGPNNRYTYASAEPAFYTDMKAVDSTINVGVPITGSTTSYSGWDPWVLGHASYDYVIFHYYPIRYPNSTDTTALTAPFSGTSILPAIGPQITTIRSELVTAGKCTSPCTSFPISISEWSTVPSKPGPQTFSIVQALFAAETLGEFFNAGVTRAEFWNSNGCELDGVSGQPSTYGWQTDVGTAGALTYSMPDSILCTGVSENYAFGTMVPTAFAFQLYSQSGFATENASAVKVDEYTSIRAYASLVGSTYHVMLINLNATIPVTVNLSIDGHTSGSSTSTIQYTKAIYDQSRNDGPFNSPSTASGGSWTTPYTITLPARSMTMVTFNP